MIGLIMCGGKGTRMKSKEEKLLLVYEKPIIQHVIKAFESTGNFSKIVCATSNNAPKTREFISTLGITMLETKGNGYASDLRESIILFDEPVFVASGDMPLLDSEIIAKILSLADCRNVWSSILVRKSFLSFLGLEAEFFVTENGEQCAYTGISVVNPKMVRNLEYVAESNIVLDDRRIAINLNTQKDYDLLCTT